MPRVTKVAANEGKKAGLIIKCCWSPHKFAHFDEIKRHAEKKCYFLFLLMPEACPHFACMDWLHFYTNTKTFLLNTRARKLKMQFCVPEQWNVCAPLMSWWLLTHIWQAVGGECVIYQVFVTCHVQSNFWMFALVNPWESQWHERPRKREALNHLKSTMTTGGSIPPPNFGSSNCMHGTPCMVWKLLPTQRFQIEWFYILVVHVVLCSCSVPKILASSVPTRMHLHVWRNELSCFRWK